MVEEKKRNRSPPQQKNRKKIATSWVATNFLILFPEFPGVPKAILPSAQNMVLCQDSRYNTAWAKPKKKHTHTHTYTHTHSCDLLRPLQGSFGPLGPKVEKQKSENGFPRPLAPGGRNGRKGVKKRVQNGIFFAVLGSFLTLSGLFRPPGPRGPGNPFSDFFSALGPKRPK